MKILVFNPKTNKMEIYYRSLSQNMPYANNLTVKEFRGSSKSDVMWTDKRLMEAWNKLRESYGKPINVGYAFKRIGEGGHRTSVTALCRNCYGYGAKAFKY